MHIWLHTELHPYSSLNGRISTITHQLTEMTYQILMLVYRKPTISPEQFRKHYETVHIPLVHEIAGPLFPLTHTRKYISREKEIGKGNPEYIAHVMAGEQADFAFDAIVEMTFQDQAAFYEFGGCLAQPTVAKQIRDDCEEFMDVSKAPAVILSDVVETRR